MEQKPIEASRETLSALENRISKAKSEGIQVFVSGGIIIRDGRVLLLMRSPKAFFPNHWDIPGGKVHPDETFIEGFRREIFEETGLTLTGIGKFISAFDFLDGQNRRTRQFNFFVSTTENQVRIDAIEHSRHEWFSQADLAHIQPLASQETFSVLQSVFRAMRPSQ
jgi:8-oxo-dGTP pyrophosphatase MutT (NUDIX family)